MLRKIDRILLRVPQLASAVHYYHDVLGMKILRQDKRTAVFALNDGSAELVLHDDEDLPFEQIYYLVDDVRDIYRRRDELQLKFITSPQQVTRGYKAAVKDPFGNVLQILDRTTESSASSGPPAIEDAKPPTALFPGIQPRVPAKRAHLTSIYEKIGRTADDLPYTPQFETLYVSYAAQHDDPKPTRQEVWRHLLNLRKAAKLPKLGEAKSHPPDVPPEARQKLREMLGDDIGKRDRLPYTDRFERLVNEFNTLLDRPLSPHLVWRLVATLAK
jgi:catechol 2,3-dioxygenase-like lactoylglutathione lyase family enzyme